MINNNQYYTYKRNRGFKQSLTDGSQPADDAKMTIGTVRSEENNHDEHIDSYEISDSKECNEGQSDQYNSIEGVIFLIFLESFISTYEKSFSCM